MTTRFLRELGDDEPTLELIEAEPEGPARGAPVLFLHGAFAGAWMWNESFLGFFARRGRRVVAVSFRGHGASGGRDRLRRTALGEYVADARRAIASMAGPPVVVAHSLGGLVAQRLIGREPMRALALMASLPPDGMALVGPRIAMTEPLIWFEAFLGSATKSRGPVTLASRQLLLYEGVPRGQVARYAAMMRPESPRALSDAHWPGLVLPARFFGLPTLVVGGDRDRLVWPSSILRTALYHGAAREIVRGAGHFLPLDRQAEEVARSILHWIDRTGA